MSADVVELKLSWGQSADSSAKRETYKRTITEQWKSYIDSCDVLYGLPEVKPKTWAQFCSNIDSLVIVARHSTP